MGVVVIEACSHLFTQVRRSVNNVFYVLWTPWETFSFTSYRERQYFIT